MTPKQKYDERKRLRLENDLREEQNRKDRMDRSDDMEASFERLLRAVERAADVLELWADMQSETP